MTVRRIVRSLISTVSSTSADKAFARTNRPLFSPSAARRNVVRDQSEINPLDKSIVWEYTAENSNRPIWTFFSHYLSGAQRQPIGNTLICEGSNGRIFEVTSAEEIVWEYVNPFPNRTPKIPNATIFRAAKVAETWLKR